MQGIFIAFPMKKDTFSKHRKPNNLPGRRGFSLFAPSPDTIFVPIIPSLRPILFFDRLILYITELREATQANLPSKSWMTKARCSFLDVILEWQICLLCTQMAFAMPAEFYSGFKLCFLLLRLMGCPQWNFYFLNWRFIWCCFLEETMQCVWVEPRLWWPLDPVAYSEGEGGGASPPRNRDLFAVNARSPLPRFWPASGPPPPPPEIMSCIRLCLDRVRFRAQLEFYWKNENSSSARDIFPNFSLPVLRTNQLCHHKCRCIS